MTTSNGNSSSFYALADSSRTDISELREHAERILRAVPSQLDNADKASFVRAVALGLIVFCDALIAPEFPA